MGAEPSVILVDLPEGGEVQSEFLENLGHPVTVCHGPTENSVCPILADGGRCELVEAAHGIVFELDLERPQHRAILWRYQEMVPPDVLIRVVVTSEQARRYADLLRGVQVWTHAPGIGDLDGFAAQVEAADRFRHFE